MEHRTSRVETVFRSTIRQRTGDGGRQLFAGPERNSANSSEFSLTRRREVPACSLFVNDSVCGQPGDPYGKRTITAAFHDTRGSYCFLTSVIERWIPPPGSGFLQCGQVGCFPQTVAGISSRLGANSISSPDEMTFQHRGQPKEYLNQTVIRADLRTSNRGPVRKTDSAAADY